MDPEKRARRQSLRVIVSEIMMFVTVVVTVIILALIVSGYWLNSDFEVERQGMLQIHSVPTGASVEVDGDAPWFQRTNTSKVLKSGEHQIVLTKDGYDSWSKTVTISEGLLYRVNYPRLFLLNRQQSVFYDTAKTTPTFATISPDRNQILLINPTTTWELVKLDSDEAKPTTLDIAKLTTLIDPDADLFIGTIVSANWDSACEHVLLELASDTTDTTDTTHEWLLLDVKNPTKSVNITREFATNFRELRIFDHSASNLLAIRNGNLHKIDVYGRQISAILAEDVVGFDFYDSEIIYTTSDSLYITRIGDQTPKLLATIDTPTKPFISRFYDEKYITLVSSGAIKLYKKDNFTEIFTAALAFAPEQVKIGHDGSFVFLNSGANVAVLDMETTSVTNWQLDSTDYGWLSGSMLYSVKDGQLIVYDFDGLNRRTLSSDLNPDFPVTITSDKWLYYFKDAKIIREIIVQ